MTHVNNKNYTVLPVTHVHPQMEDMPAFTAQPQSITALSPVLFPIQLRVEGWVVLGDWLRNKVVCPFKDGYSTQY